MPKVSVVIITYNRSELLRTAIRSVLSQSYQDFELIVVDDASRDNTSEMVQAFDDQKIRYIRHETNKKEAGARNTGVLNSTGEYIAFLDDDDEWLPEKLQRQVHLLDRSPPTVGGIYTGLLRIDGATRKTLLQMVPTKRGNIFLDLLIENLITPSTVLLRRECFETVGLFDANIPFGLDWDMWIRISKEFQFEYISEPLVRYYVHDSKLSTNYQLMIEGREAQLKKYAGFFALNSKCQSHHYLDIGIFYCYIGNTIKGREAFIKAMNIYPFEPRHYFNLLLSLLGPRNFKKLKELKDNFL